MISGNGLEIYSCGKGLEWRVIKTVTKQQKWDQASECDSNCCGWVTGGVVEYTIKL